MKDKCIADCQYAMICVMLSLSATAARAFWLVGYLDPSLSPLWSLLFVVYLDCSVCGGGGGVTEELRIATCIYTYLTRFIKQFPTLNPVFALVSIN